MATINRKVGRPSLVQEYITLYLEKVSKAIIADQKEKDLVASGESIKSHEITIGKGYVEMDASGYYPFLVEGRAPGKMPPVDKIRQWCIVRGIDPNMAWPIARKQAKEGSAIYRGDREGIDLLEILTKDEGVLMRQVGKQSTSQVTDELLKAFSKNDNTTVK